MMKNNNRKNFNNNKTKLIILITLNNLINHNKNYKFYNSK